MTDYKARIRAYYEGGLVISCVDALQLFVLRKGTALPGAKRPKGIRKQADRACFRNAAILAMSRPDDFLYMEGLADHQHFRGLPIHHAWCISRATGAVVDSTWSDSESADYLGVEFEPDRLAARLLTSRVYGLLDTGHGRNLPLMEELDPGFIDLLGAERIRGHALRDARFRNNSLQFA